MSSISDGTTERFLHLLELVAEYMSFTAKYSQVQPCVKSLGSGIACTLPLI